MEIVNRKAFHDYEILERYEAGIVLVGTEIKSIRAASANIKDSYAIVKEDEVFILNMHISPYDKGNIFNHEETRTRKLLLNKKEILKLKENTKIEGYTLIPLKVYFVRGRVKVQIGVAKGKKLYDKREDMKRKDMQREALSNMKKSFK